MNLVTPDGRYFVIKGQLWRCSNPSLKEDVRQSLVDELMAARREVKEAKALGNTSQMKLARENVHKAKVALGERGPVWWSDSRPDLNRHRITNTLMPSGSTRFIKLNNFRHKGEIWLRPPVTKKGLGRAVHNNRGVELLDPKPLLRQPPSAPIRRARGKAYW